MTAVIHHGPPGSYKTFSLVQRVMIPALEQGRLVITNVRGFNNIDRIKSVMDVDIPDHAQIMYLEPDTAGYEAMAKFFHWAPAGALIVMDEGQRVFPVRDRRFDHLDQPDNILILDVEEKPLINSETNAYICRPATLEIAIDQHRHYNWDIYISTPNIGKIHAEIRKCVEWGYRHRDNTGLLPWYKNTWTEFRHDSEQNGKSASHYSGTPKRYKADKKIFECYQSTATGTAKLSNENISIFRDPKIQMLFFLIAAALSYVVYAGLQAWQRIDSRSKPVDQASVVKTAPAASPAGYLSTGNDSGRDVVSHSNKASRVVNPFAGMPIYLVGSINDIDLFEVELSDKRLVHLTTIELRNFGYVTAHRNRGVYVVFDLNGQSIYAFSKPQAQPLQVGARLALADSMPGIDAVSN
jgi:zona occludens toxin